MEIKETIYVKKEDIYNFNLYLLGLSKNFGLLFVGVIFIILGIYGLIDQKDNELLYDILTIIVGILGVLFATVLNKLVLKRKIKKLSFDDMPPIDVIVDEKGILYKYVEEDSDKEYLPYKWNEIHKIVKTNDYLFIHMIDRRTIILITIRDLQSDSLISELKTKFVPLKKFIEKK